MSDSTWGMIVTFLIIAGTRILDAFLPEGYMLRWVNKYLRKKPKDASNRYKDTPKDSEQDT